MKRPKTSQPLDTQQKHNELSSDGIKKRWRPIDHLQTLRTNFQQTRDQSSEKLLKLSPYPILNTDPTLNNLNYSKSSFKSPQTLSK